MAHTYHLLCFDCGVYLSMGKVHSIAEESTHLETATFDGVYEERSEERHKRDEIFGRAIEAFLIRHRNHELRFVPEGVDELLESASRSVRAVETQELLSPCDVAYDAEAELARWHSSLRQDRRNT